MRKPVFCICDTKRQISFAVTAKLISAFVFATWIVQSLYFLNTKFQASSNLLRLYSLICVGPGRIPEDRFSHKEAQTVAKGFSFPHVDNEDSDLAGRFPG